MAAYSCQLLLIKAEQMQKVRRLSDHEVMYRDGALICDDLLVREVQNVLQ